MDKLEELKSQLSEVEEEKRRLQNEIEQLEEEDYRDRFPEGLVDFLEKEGFEIYDDWGDSLFFIKYLNEDELAIEVNFYSNSSKIDFFVSELNCYDCFIEKQFDGKEAFEEYYKTFEIPKPQTIEVQVTLKYSKLFFDRDNIQNLYKIVTDSKPDADLVNLVYDAIEAGKYKIKETK